MTLCLSLLLCLLCLGAHTAEATIYYLKPSTGLDSNNGTATSTPWKTFTKAKSKTCGGGTSACLAPGDTLRIMGGTYVPSDYKGVSGQVKWTQNDSLGTAGNVITITNNPGDTVVFDGLTTETYWIWFEATVASYPGHYIVVDGTNKNIRFTRYRGAAPAFRGDSDTTFMHHGALINTEMDSTFPQMGAGTQTRYAHHIIFRGNYIHDTGPNSAPSGSAEHGIYQSPGTQYVVTTNNTFTRIAGYALHYYIGNVYNEGSASYNNIARYNIMNNCRNGCLVFSGGWHRNNYVYNNTCYNDLIPRPDMDSNSANQAFAETLAKDWNGHRIINNIFSGYYTIATMNVATYSNITTNLLLDYNIWRNISNTNGVFRWDADTTTTTKYSLAGFQGITTFEDNGTSNNPNFVLPASGNFVLGVGSAAIDAGRNLTTAVGAGSSSTTLTVADAGYFYDGFGMLTGDTIKIGTAAVVSITNVNYSTNVITLSAARSWGNGDAVNLPFSGEKPDMGALESPVNVLVFTTQPVSTEIAQTMANVVVTVQDGTGATVPSFESNVTLSKNSGAGTVAGTLTQTAVAGVATFNDLSVDTVGVYTLSATGSGMPSTTSEPFNGTATPSVPTSSVSAMRGTRIR